MVMAVFGEFEVFRMEGKPGDTLVLVQEAEGEGGGCWCYIDDEQSSISPGLRHDGTIDRQEDAE